MKNYELFHSLCNQLEFNVKVCSSVKHDNKWVECESKDCYDIWLVTDGNIEAELSGKNFTLSKGDVFFFYPQMLYTARCKSQFCSFIFIRFDIVIEKNIRPINDFSFYGVTKGEDIKCEAEMFIEAFNSYKNDNFLSPLFLKGNLINLFAKIALTRFENKSLQSMLNDKSAYFKLQKLISHITLNSDKKLTVKNLADYLCMSEKYFITYFKKTTGITPFTFISNIKLKRAMEYLSEQSYSVKETAEMLGYTDQYTFSKAFKRYYGFSPSSVYNSNR